MVAPTLNTDWGAADWEMLRHLLNCRSGGLCECCGGALTRGSTSVHHRKPRGMGGTRDPEVHALHRVILVHGDGTRGCHGWAESHREDATERGLLVPQSGDTRTTPVTLWSGRRVLLAAEAPFYLDSGEYGERLEEVSSWSSWQETVDQGSTRR